MSFVDDTEGFTFKVFMIYCCMRQLVEVMTEKGEEELGIGEAGWFRLRKMKS